MRTGFPGVVEFARGIGQSWSAAVLIGANLVPLFGVIFGGWNAFDIVWLFWFENVIIGVFNVIKILTVGALGNPGGQATGRTQTVVGSRLARVSPGQRAARMAGMTFLAAFFTVHYGGFNFGHGIFVMAMLGKGSGMHAGFSLWDLYVTNTRAAIGLGLGPAILTLLASHAFSFVANFLVKREYARIDQGALMGGPYARVVILHVAIIFGGFFAMALGSPMGVLVVLVLLKIAVDLGLHLKERQHSGAIPLAALARGKR